MAITVGELSRISGVTVRTLHHYDEIGLLRPSGRTGAGYRLYDDDDVLRLHQILVLRELGMPLDEIGAALAAGIDRGALLRQHRAALVEKRGQLDTMLVAIDHALEALEKGHTMMTPNDFETLFDGFDPSVHDDEVKQRWGDTPAYAESQRRVKRYGKAEWAQLGAEAAAINQRLVELMTAGAAPTDPRVQAAVADHRAHITKWFYDCSPEIHRGLGEMYVADPRFTANIDKAAPGLAAFLSAAIRAS
ncbi:MAG: MerR family transcriptional regulator [Kofleriaceae bacterium]